MRLEITSQTQIICNGALTSIDQHEPEFHLYAVKWAHDGLTHGISFHCKHYDAKRFCERMKVRRIEPLYERESKIKLVKVSKWLYDQVSEVGDYWTSLHTFRDAEFFTGPTQH
jgi:hypothetical protein